MLPAEVRHHAKRALIDWFASLLPGTIVDPAQAMIKGSRGRTRPRPRVRLRLGNIRIAARRRPHQRHRLAHHRIRRHLPRRHLPSGMPDDQRRARRGAGQGLKRRRSPHRDHRRLRGLDAHRALGAAVTLQVLAHDRHHRHVWRRRRRRHHPETRPRKIRARARDVRDDGGGVAAGVPLRFDVEAAARRPCCRSRRHGCAQRRIRHDRRARRARRRSRFRRRHEHHGRLEQGDRRPRRALQHHADDLQEPRLLRPRLPGHRRRAAPQSSARLRARSDQAHPHRRLSRDAGSCRRAQSDHAVRRPLLDAIPGRERARPRQCPPQRLRTRNASPTHACRRCPTRSN